MTILIRDQLGIRPGTRLDFEVQPDGTLIGARVDTRAAGLFGLIAQPGEAARSLDEIDAGIAAAVSERARCRRWRCQRMIAIDTNVVVRLFVNDDAVQAARPRALFATLAEQDDSLWVADMVLAELVRRGAGGLRDLRRCPPIPSLPSDAERG